MGGDGRGDGERSKLGPLADQYLDRDKEKEGWKKIHFPPDRKPYMVTKSLTACNVTKARNA